MKKILFLILLCALFLFSGQAYALYITPIGVYEDNTSTELLDSTLVVDSGPQNNWPDITSALNSSYSFNTSGWTEYDEASYFNSDGSGGLIPWFGEEWLVVKDGKNDPAWYLFELPLFDGTDNLIGLANFWPNQGGISGVRLYGEAAPVPEPSTLLLLGLGLVGLAGYGRKRMKQ